jgi:hypothetical protein
MRRCRVSDKAEKRDGDGRGDRDDSKIGSDFGRIRISGPSALASSSCNVRQVPHVRFVDINPAWTEVATPSLPLARGSIALGQVLGLGKAT